MLVSWGTPCFNTIHSDRTPITDTCCNQTGKKLSTKCIAEGETHNERSFLRRIWCGSGSNAFDRSSRTACTILPTSISCWIVSIKYKQHLSKKLSIEYQIEVV